MCCGTTCAAGLAVESGTRQKERGSWLCGIFGSQAVCTSSGYNTTLSLPWELRECRRLHNQESQMTGKCHGITSVNEYCSNSKKSIRVIMWSHHCTTKTCSEGHAVNLYILKYWLILDVSECSLSRCLSMCLWKGECTTHFPLPGSDQICCFGCCSQQFYS